MLCNQKLTGSRVAITTYWKLLNNDVNYFTTPLSLTPVNIHCYKEPRGKKKGGLEAGHPAQTQGQTLVLKGTICWTKEEKAFCV